MVKCREKPQQKNHKFLLVLYKKKRKKVFGEKSMQWIGLKLKSVNIANKRT